MDEIMHYESDEEAYQAHQDLWALRILTCPKPSCRRTRDCKLGPETCPGWRTHPSPQALQHAQLRMVRNTLVQRRAAILAGPEASAAWDAAEQKLIDRCHRLAFQRAEAALGRKRAGS